MKNLDQKIYFSTIIIYLLLAVILVIADLTGHLSTTLVRSIATLYILITLAYALYYFKNRLR